MFTTNSDIQDVSTIVEDYTAVDKVRHGREETSNQITADTVQSRLSDCTGTPSFLLCCTVKTCSPSLQVTLLHVESEEEESLSSHFFKVDALVENVTLLITGSLSECILTSPSGRSRAGSQRCLLRIQVEFCCCRRPDQVLLLCHIRT